MEIRLSISQQRDSLSQVVDKDIADNGISSKLLFKIRKRFVVL
jgi:hypothetical protein